MRSLFDRIGCVPSGGVDGAADTLEQAAEMSVLREAIREVERATAALCAEWDAAATRRLQAMRQQRIVSGQLACLAEKTSSARSNRQGGVVDAAVSQHSTLQTESARLHGIVREAGAETARVESCLAALKTRVNRMRETLGGLEADQPEATLVLDRRAEPRPERPGLAFPHAMGQAGGAAHEAEPYRAR